jgi:hypothetical protein
MASSWAGRQKWFGKAGREIRKMVEKGKREKENQGRAKFRVEF